MGFLLVDDNLQSDRRKTRLCTTTVSLAGRSGLELNLNIELVGNIRNRVARADQDAASGLPLRSPLRVRKLVIGNWTKPVRLIVKRAGVSEILNLTVALDS